MTTNNLAITEIIKAMQTDAEEIMNLTDLASGEIGQGNRNSAMVRSAASTITSSA